MLFVSSLFAIETSYKHNQVANSSISSNLNIDIELELEMNAEFTDPIDYTHIQILIEKPFENMTLATGVRGISERIINKNSEDFSYCPMLEAKLNYKIEQLSLKNRLRYIYDIDNDKHTIRYRIGTPFSLIYGFMLTPAIEAFIDEQFNYKRTRYSANINKPFDKWTTKLGYEYNDNENKTNSQTITTELEYSF